MSKIRAILNNSGNIEFESGITAGEILDNLKLKNKFAVQINNTSYDLSKKITDSGITDSGINIKFIAFSDTEGKDIYRHSSSHIMALALLRIYKNIKFAIGPSIDDGFYYDIDMEKSISPEGLEKIEEEIQKIIKENIPFERQELSKDDAIELFKKSNAVYKLQLLQEIDSPTVSIYKLAEFVDLCKGPHVPSTSYINSVKLMKIAGAYWRGNEKNKMLQRIYGISFPDRKMLKQYLFNLEEAKKRDHRILGKQLDLYSINDEYGAGLVYWHPNGAAVRNQIETFWKEEHQKRGYQLLYIPHIAKEKLWSISGHLENYKEYIYSPMQIDENDYYIKPMNCPGHILIYKSKKRSYKELPIRWAELGTVYRYEKSGVLQGLFRVRGFTQDDAHIFCTPEQLEEELISTIELVQFMLETFKFEKYQIMLSTRPEKKYVGTDEIWEHATNALANALKIKNIEYGIDEGGGAFYGPKIDIKLFDAIGRGHQGPTIQVDFNLPDRFDINFIGSDGKEHKAVMIHRAVLGSMERFMGTLIEHYSGKFPTWLAPVQVLLIGVSDEQNDEILKLEEELRSKMIRVSSDVRDENVGYKIRDAQMNKIPYMIVIGKKEIDEGTVSVRQRDKKDVVTIKKEEFINNILNEVNQRR